MTACKNCGNPLEFEFRLDRYVHKSTVINCNDPQPSERKNPVPSLYCSKHSETFFADCEECQLTTKLRVIRMQSPKEENVNNCVSVRHQAETFPVIKTINHPDFLKRFRVSNTLRAVQDFKTFDNAGLLYFTTALSGEAGELGEIITMLIANAMLNTKIGGLNNLIKKLERAKHGGPDAGHSSHVADITHAKIVDEIGGIHIYLDLLSALLQVQAEEAITTTFNRVSEEIGSGYRL